MKLSPSVKATAITLAMLMPGVVLSFLPPKIGFALFITSVLAIGWLGMYWLHGGERLRKWAPRSFRR
jgi:hypothetical protein